MTPREIVRNWVDAFNSGDAEKLSSYYTPDATNHQVPEIEVRGQAAIRQMFESEFDKAEMHCIIENIFEDGEWGILEWKDPLGLRGCGFFQISDGKIKYQRGYWDKLSFLRQHKLPIPHE